MGGRGDFRAVERESKWVTLIRDETLAIKPWILEVLRFLEDLWKKLEIWWRFGWVMSERVREWLWS